MRKLLFYGGAFDPPHKGHERLFESALEEVKPDIALIIPTGVSPHKTRSRTPFWTRYEMCNCFKREGYNVKISSIECRGHKCYTFETLKRLKKIYPDHEIFMLIGSDMVTSFDTWHLYRRIMASCTIVAGCRSETDRAACSEAVKKLEKQGGKFMLLTFDPVEVSSTLLRKGLGEGSDVSDYLSDDVASVIERKGLYR